MKKRILPFACFFFLINWGFSQNVIYVNQAATGANTGTSWANAFTGLQNALMNANEGDEIWVAAGTYLPGPFSFSSFQISVDLMLLGGFDGTETSAEQRDPQINITILSGDLNGDDIENDLENNRSDNVTTALRVTSNITSATLVDGFTIRSGHADGSGSDDQKNGGGLFCNGDCTIKRCKFLQNYAIENGGGGYVVGGNVIFENCLFANNRADIMGGGLNAFNPSWLNLTGIQAQVLDCTFENNSCFNSGAGICYSTFADESGLSISGCTFLNNHSNWNGGGVGAFFHGYNAGFEAKNCHFTGNSSLNNGGGLHVETIEPADLTTIMVDSCSFSQNTSSTYTGGGFTAYLGGTNNELMLINSGFTGNVAEGQAGAGGAEIAGISNTSSGVAHVGNCLFEGNSGVSAVGGLDVAAIPGSGYFEFTIVSCDFINNSTDDVCGGLNLYAERPASFRVDDCLFEGNTAEGISGGINISNTHSEVEAIFSNCVIVENTGSFGAAIGAFPYPEDPENFMIAADAQIKFENCLITNNSGDEGAVGLKQTGDVKFLNCTIAENPAGGIVLDSVAVITLQNTILYNPGTLEFEALADDVSVTSSGGNLIADSSLDEWLNDTDQPSSGPMLDSDYHLMQGSPAIDAGVAYVDMPALDLAGNGRLQGSCLDIGAFESPYDLEVMQCKVVNSAREVLSDLPLALSPNPASSYVQIDLPVITPESFNAQVLDAQGKVVAQYQLHSGELLNVNELPQGIYLVKMVAGEHAYVGRFAKR